jgi:hypothetical protein
MSFEIRFLNRGTHILRESNFKCVIGSALSDQEIDMAKQAKTKKSSTKIRANKRKAKLRGKEKRRRARSNKED